jgi:tetratricopeptide (TPR) repeat protein
MSVDAQVEVLDGWSRLARTVPSNKSGPDQLPEYLAEVTGVPCHRVLEIRAVRNRIAHEGTSSVSDEEAGRVATTIREMQGVLDQIPESRIGAQDAGPITHLAAVLLAEVEELCSRDGGSPSALEQAIAGLQQKLVESEPNNDLVMALDKAVRELRRFKNRRVKEYSNLLAVSGRQFRLSYVGIVPAFADLLRLLVRVHCKAGHAAVALPLAEEYVGIRKSLMNDQLMDDEQVDDDAFWERKDFGDALIVLGQTLGRLGRHHEAASVKQQAVALARETWPLSADLPFCLVDVALSLSDAGRPVEALTAADEALYWETQLRREDPNRDTTNLSWALICRSDCLYKLGQFSAAKSTMREATAMSPQLAATLNPLRKVQNRLGRLFGAGPPRRSTSA